MPWRGGGGYGRVKPILRMMLRLDGKSCCNVCCVLVFIWSFFSLLLLDSFCFAFASSDRESCVGWVVWDGMSAFLCGGLGVRNGRFSVRDRRQTCSRRRFAPSRLMSMAAAENVKVSTALLSVYALADAEGYPILQSVRIRCCADRKSNRSRKLRYF